ncbi:MAG TPA: lamin tail domain-containing protein, partial [Kofleriaceae bacterium]|nr:lamin tail domain-containing protein [Kofleriaceae bacterium]
MQAEPLSTVRSSWKLCRLVTLGLSAALGAGACGAEAPEVLFSEIHYHPALEDDYEDRHEFVEIYNDGSSKVDLSGWKLVGSTVSFEFPDGSSIAPGEYRVIAKNRDRLAQVWALEASTLLGDYTGELDNGKETLWLLDGDGAEIDKLTYDDDAPWPVAADAL